MRRPKWTIRGLLVLTLLVALICWWRQDGPQKAYQEIQYQKYLETIDGPEYYSARGEAIHVTTGHAGYDSAEYCHAFDRSGPIFKDDFRSSAEVIFWVTDFERKPDPRYEELVLEFGKLATERDVVSVIYSLPNTSPCIYGDIRWGYVHVLHIIEANGDGIRYKVSRWPNRHDSLLPPSLTQGNIKWPDQIISE